MGSPHTSPTENQGITLKARHIPGKLNVFADQLSRPDQIMNTEWSIHPSVIQQIALTWEMPHIDMFATKFNFKLPTYMSPIPDPAAYAVDALTQDWTNILGYAYPPTALIHKILAKMLIQQCRIYLIAPKYPQQTWYPKLLQLLMDNPRDINHPTESLLRQPNNDIMHQNPRTLNLHVWPLSSRLSDRKDFLRKCPTGYHTASENHLFKSTRVSGSIGEAGVLNGKSILILPLFRQSQSS